MYQESLQIRSRATFELSIDQLLQPVTFRCGRVTDDRLQCGVSGVMMPHMAVHTFTFNSSNWKDRPTFEINPQYDPQFFEQPPTARMGPESWRLPSR